MQPPTNKLRSYLRSFDFQNLFVEELGWDFYRSRQIRITADDHEYVLEPVAHKAGFAAYVCSPNADGVIPDSPIRRKIERRVTNLVYEHLIIFVDASKTVQVWQWVKREAGRPPACREYSYYTTQTGKPLRQRLGDFSFTLED